MRKSHLLLTAFDGSWQYWGLGCSCSSTFCRWNRAWWRCQSSCRWWWQKVWLGWRRTWRWQRKRSPHVSFVPRQENGQAKGLWPVPSPAQNGKQSPDQSVQPDPHAQQLCFLPADFLTCKDKMMKALLWKNKNYIPDFPKTKCRLQGRIKVSMPK